MSQTRTTLAVVTSLGIFALLVGVAWRAQRTLELGLPPKTECATEAEARAAASIYSAQNGGSLLGVLGTGSMAPYILAAPAGAVPDKTLVAYVVTAAGATFADVTAGKVCVYQHAASSVGVTMHGAAKKTSTGWIMSGLHNPVSDVWMTADTFKGIVAHAYTWPVAPQ